MQINKPIESLRFGDLMNMKSSEIGKWAFLRSKSIVYNIGICKFNFPRFIFSQLKEPLKIEWKFKKKKTVSFGE